MDFNAEPELGAFGADNVSFECVNTAFAGSTRMSNVLFDDDPLFSAWHVRLSYKPAGGSYSYLWQGVIDAEDTEVEMQNDSDPDTWSVKFTAVDTILQMEEKPTSLDAFGSFLTHASYSKSVSGGVYISWSDGGTAHSTALQKLDIDVYSDPARLGWRSYTKDHLYIMRLTDILQALSNAIGVTGSANLGSAPAHTWKFVYYDGSADQEADFEDLAIISKVDDGVNPVIQDHGFFDSSGQSEISFYNAGSVLEMLKHILLPFGMIARMRLDSSGDRYLEYREIQDYTSNTYTEWLTPAGLNPALRGLYGIKVRQTGVGDLVTFSAGDGSIPMLTHFTTANRIPNCYQWRHDPAGAEPGRCDDYSAFLGSLWYYDAANDRIYSIYKIKVRTDGNTGSGLFANSHIFSRDYDHDYAGMVMAEAMAHYWFNVGVPTTGTNSTPLGIYRRRMRGLDITVPGIKHDPAAPLHEIGQYITWDGKRWWITGKRFDFRNHSTSFTAESGDW
ncbi:MAG: hypothetical protein CL946_02150 [Ectothiorhodospiraceae bacterium]|nr:hypothetical protein [Ectothiorhodospiraceae bacterium]